MPYTNVQFTEMVRLYAISGNNVSRTRRLYAEMFPGQNVPNRETVLAATQRLRLYGQFTVPAHAQGRGNQRLPVDLEEDILNFFAENPEESTRRAARIFGVSHWAVWKLLHRDGQHPYHFQPVQELNADDHLPRMVFAQWLLMNIDTASILFTDEATFTRSGIYNVHNEHYWHHWNEHRVRNHYFQRRFSVNVWAGILGGTLLGPYFIEGNLRGLSYLRILRRVFNTMLDEVPLQDLRNLYFQHDGAPAHFQLRVRAYLDREFPGHWIGRGGPIAWPARSPDLTPLDFYLWGEMKRRVYATEYNTRRELKVRIRNAFNDIRNDPFVLSRVRNNLRRRAEACVAVNGAHFQQLLSLM